MTIFSASKQILLKKFQNHSQHHTPPKLQFDPRQQIPAIKSHNHPNTTTTPPHNNNKNQNHRERSVGRSRDCAEARSSSEIERREIEGEIDRRTGACDLGFLSIVELERAIVGLERTIWASSRSSDCSMRSSDPETTIWASSATSKA